MRSIPPVRRRILHVLAAYDPKEAQGRCVRTVATGAPDEHHLVCGHQIAAGDEFAGVIETNAGLSEFGWRDRDRLADAVARVRPHIVHFHGGPLGAAAIAGGWTGNVPVVASIYAWTTIGRHSFGRGVGLGHLRTTPVLASRSFANTIVPRSTIVAALRRAGVRAVTTPDPAIRDALANHALPVGLFEGITEPVAPYERRPITGHFVFAGRAELTRGPDLLADAIRLLRSRGRDVSARFCFLGTPDAEMVAMTADSAGCTVSIGGVDLEAEMRLASAVVLPFRYDDATLAPTLVATEALAAGVPVIGADVRCIRAAVSDGETGLLVPPGDVGALADAIVRLIDAPDLARRLGTNGVAETARRWNVSNVIDLARWSYDLASVTSVPATPVARHRPAPATARPMLSVAHTNARQESR